MRIAAPALLLLVSTPAFAASDPKKLQAARELVAAERTVETMREAALVSFDAEFMETVAQSCAAKCGHLIEAGRAAGKAGMSDVLNQLAPQITAEFAEAYAQRLTVEDMKAATAFYTSASGQRFIAVGREIMNPSTQRVQELVAPHMPALQKRVMDAIAAAAKAAPEMKTSEK